MEKFTGVEEKMSCPRVSFIVPVYNVAQFLPACLDSIINQSENNIEIICINDCSPDHSMDIIHSYAAEDPRFKLIDFKENRGPGAARNAGLDAVSGEFVRMVDGDDFIPPESTAKLLEAAKKYQSDFVRGGFRNCTVTNRILGKGWNFPAELTVNASIKDERRLWRFDQHWAFLYRTSSLRQSGARYDESMRNGQDAAFMVDLLPHFEKVTFIPETVYYYRENPRSTMRRQREKRFYLNVLDLYARVYERFATIGVREAGDFIFYNALCYYLPDKILSSIPENLEENEVVEVLQHLHAILLKQDGKNLCFTRPYSWQASLQMPGPAKYLALLICEGYLDDALHAIKHMRQSKEKEQHLLQRLSICESQLKNVYASTSWRITAPVRRMVELIKSSSDK